MASWSTTSTNGLIYFHVLQRRWCCPPLLHMAVHYFIVLKVLISWRLLLSRWMRPIICLPMKSCFSSFGLKMLSFWEFTSMLCKLQLQNQVSIMNIVSWGQHHDDCTMSCIVSSQLIQDHTWDDINSFEAGVWQRNFGSSQTESEEIICQSEKKCHFFNLNDCAYMYYIASNCLTQTWAQSKLPIYLDKVSISNLCVHSYSVVLSLAPISKQTL